MWYGALHSDRDVHQNVYEYRVRSPFQCCKFIDGTRSCSPVRYGALMERLLEKSLDEQYAMERQRRSAQALVNRRLLWVMFPMGTAFAVAAYYLDISTRIAIPVLVELQEGLQYYDPRPDYAVFRLNLSAFVRLLPSALIAGTLGIWVSVYVVTYNGRKFVAWMYVLIGLIYAVTFTAILGLLIPLNVWILNKSGLSITDSVIPFSDEITSFGDAVFMFPYSYVVTGMERGLWAAAAVIVLTALVVRLAGGLSTRTGTFRALTVNSAITVMFLGTLLFGPLGIHQFLFDQFVQLPATALGILP